MAACPEMYQEEGQLILASSLLWRTHGQSVLSSNIKCPLSWKLFPVQLKGFFYWASQTPPPPHLHPSHTHSLTHSTFRLTDCECFCFYLHSKTTNGNFLSCNITVARIQSLSMQLKRGVKLKSIRRMRRVHWLCAFFVQIFPLQTSYLGEERVC